MKTFENRPLLWGSLWTLIMAALQIVLIRFQYDNYYLVVISYGGLILVVNFLLYWRSSFFHTTLSGEQIARFLRRTLVLTVIGTAYFLGLYLLQNSLMIEFRGINPRFKITVFDVTNILMFVPAISMVSNGYFTTAAIRKHGLPLALVISGIMLLVYASSLTFLPNLLEGRYPDTLRILATLYFILDFLVLPSTLFLLICHKWNMPAYNWTFFLGLGLLFSVLVDMYYSKYFPNHHLFSIPITGALKAGSYVMHGLGFLLQVLLIVGVAYIRPRKKPEPMLSEENLLIDNE